ncbi:MAG TPA: hypothetical protein VMU76_02565 [Acidimicrobiales bacterium]|nr:hypothetical protein [Acidimicrobiales bacterium]
MAKTLIDIDESLLQRARETIDWIIATDPIADLRDPEVRAAARR